MTATITPDQFSTQATAWLTAFTTTATALLGFLAYVLPKLAKLKADNDTLFTLHHKNAAEIANNARAITPTVSTPDTSPAPLTTPPTNGGFTTNQAVNAIAILSIVALIVAPFLCGGCAGSAADQDFRRKVSAVDVSGGGSYQPDTGVYGGQASAHFVLRNPDSSK